MTLLAVSSVLMSASMLTPMQACPIPEVGLIYADDGGYADSFGRAVAMDGSLIVVGSFTDEFAVNSGSAYVFDLNTGQQIHKLLPDDPGFGQFGNSTDIHGPIALIGRWIDDEHGNNAGSAYLFDVSTGLQLHKLRALDPSPGDYFGVEVALNATHAFVGAYIGDNDDTGVLNTGAVYAFDIATGSQQAKLTASDSASNDRFGYEVACNEDYLLVGAHRDDDNGDDSGAVYVFDAQTMQELRKLLPDDGAADDFFGVSIAIDDHMALIGASEADPHGDRSGAAYIFDVETGRQLHKLTAPDGEPNDQFGHAVAIDGNVALVTAPLTDLTFGSGVVYMFDTTTGQLITTLRPASDPEFGDFGHWEVAIENDTVVVGAESTFGVESNTGAAYIFDLTQQPPDCPGDFNCDQSIDVDDLNRVLSGFGTLNDLNDLNAVLSNWGSPCVP